jgi:hypothetical protein
MEKSNKDKTIPSGRSDINLENPSSSEASVGNSKGS